MIPIHEDLIEKINRKKNIIHIDIPDGLIEII
jgi:NAD(P)H-hydrate repair Nnr-like enzyme with NAD(P)H-hydrate epimerase domain